jgi:hypothetical protein
MNIKFTDREVILVLRTLLVSIFDSCKLRAKTKDRISEALSLVDAHLNGQEPSNEQ